MSETNFSLSPEINNENKNFLFPKENSIQNFNLSKC